ncbi:MAG: 30S ribosomal protein S20 [Chloroherpetonaceae bacterium]|nr:30S ribosomal protein S20 [Chloroherpetonaceae bacterium]MCS7212020.1 30S ribosomal protein S20 [Chloroherpetonaceae bacterium]MDW8020724.1 30S ribosomal protein S20 [Chloroherpetonaceae bacterium]
MPQHKSAEKRVRQSKRRNAYNRAHKREAKQLIKAVQRLVAAGAPQAEIEQAYRAAARKLDRIACKGIIHKNKAARHKSALAKLINRHTASVATAAPASQS